MNAGNEPAPLSALDLISAALWIEQTVKEDRAFYARATTLPQSALDSAERSIAERDELAQRLKKEGLTRIEGGSA